MAEATATTTTRPRARKAAGSATKATPKTATPKTAAAAETGSTIAAAEDGTQRITFELEAADPTKSYAKFAPPKDSGCVGTLYVPLGTQIVKVLLIGPAE